MPGPYRRLDVPNVNQYVVTTAPAKAKKKAAAPAAADVKAGGDRLTAIDISNPANPTVVVSKSEPAKPATETVKKSTASK